MTIQDICTTPIAINVNLYIASRYFIDMKTDNSSVPQLFLRLALGLGFLLAAMDRFGWLGGPGGPGVAWGNWQNFANYTHTLLPYLNSSLSNIAAIVATIAEFVFGIFLIIGFKTKAMAIGSFLLTLCFALSMALFAGFRAPFSYSVFVDSAASLVLAAIPYYKWSVDYLLSNKQPDK